MYSSVLVMTLWFDMTCLILQILLLSALPFKLILFHRVLNMLKPFLIHGYNPLSPRVWNFTRLIFMYEEANSLSLQWPLLKPNTLLTKNTSKATPCLPLMVEKMWMVEKSWEGWGSPKQIEGTLLGTKAGSIVLVGDISYLNLLLVGEHYNKVFFYFYFAFMQRPYRRLEKGQRLLCKTQRWCHVRMFIYVFLEELAIV